MSSDIAKGVIEKLKEENAALQEEVVKANGLLDMQMKELAKLREDKDRLDSGQIMLTAFGLREHHVGIDLRAAIDAARKEAEQ